jgi:hypothetical protein
MARTLINTKRPETHTIGISIHLILSVAFIHLIVGMILLCQQHFGHQITCQGHTEVDNYCASMWHYLPVGHGYGNNELWKVGPPRKTFGFYKITFAIFISIGKLIFH